jgi:hypothetical protein
MSGDSGERGVSEGAGVAVLVLFTVLVTASVGINVLFLDDSPDGIHANFSFEYRQEGGYLTVTHAEGQDLNGSNLYFEGADANASWAELAGANGSITVTQGDIVRLSDGNAYGQRIAPRDTIEVVYIDNGNRTVLDTWSGGDGGGLG